MIFERYDADRNGFLELREVTLLINSTLRHYSTGLKVKMGDAKAFMEIADINNDEKISREELYKLFEKLLNRGH